LDSGDFCRTERRLNFDAERWVKAIGKAEDLEGISFHHEKGRHSSPLSRNQLSKMFSDGGAGEAGVDVTERAIEVEQQMISTFDHLRELLTLGRGHGEKS
jgi:hypothetical protein